MAAGQGFKTFTSGEVLTAADVNGYLMQGVGVFTDAANRDAEITSPQEGQFAYLKDTNVTTYYTGSAWANLDTTGMTNPMTTTGDTIYSSSGSTPARLGIGTTGQVLTVSGAGIPSWATAGGGSFNTGYAYTAARQFTTSSTFVDLTTVNSVTVTTGTKALVIIKAAINNNGVANVWSNMSFAVSGATTIAASSEYSTSMYHQAANNHVQEASSVFVVTGLTAGSNTFTSKYSNAGGAASDAVFERRSISVVNLGS
jgi:hypothetical protein